MQKRNLIVLLSALGICLTGGCETQYDTLPQGGTGGVSSVGTNNGATVTWGDPISGASGASGAAQSVLPGSGGVVAPITGGAIAPPLTGGIGGGTPVAGGVPVGGAVPVGGGGVAGEVAGSGGVIDVPPNDAGIVVPVGDAEIVEPPPPEQEACPPTSDLQPGEITVSIQAGGRNRSFILYVPASYTGQTRVPLVIDWHGILMSSRFERTISGWAELAEREGFIVAFPEGLDTAIVEQIQQHGCIHTKQIYSVGYSLGGGMAMHMACNAADLFASVATSAFDLIWEQDYQCNPSRPIAIMSFRNVLDPICPYNGGPTWPPNGLPVVVTFLGAQETFAKWSQLNGCSGSPAAGAGGCPTYSQCAEGVEVTLCTDTNQTAGHGWMDAQIAWEFLKRHPMP
jgi:polyhydroxybutyrate depolymerase